MKIADLSYYDGKINWELARKELDFVIFRASIDNRGDTNYLDYAENCHLPFGVYHFYKGANKAEVIKETEFFYNYATQNNLKPLFYCLDIEHTTHTSKNVKEVCLAGLETLRKFNVPKVGLYIGQSLYPYIKDIIDQFDFIWIPRYGKDTGLMDEKYKPIYPYDLWQYTSKGKVSGINHAVDLNTLGDKTLEWFLNKEDTNNMKEKILVTTSSLNVRSGDATTYPIIGVLSKGEKIVNILDLNNMPIISINNWYAIKYNNQIGWVSGKYIKEGD